MNRRKFLSSAFALVASGLWVPAITPIQRLRVGQRPKKKAASTASNITADLWQTFEFDTLDATNLANNDNCASGTWSVSDTGAQLSTHASGELATLATLNGVADSGTKGLAQALTAATAGYVRYNIASATDSVSCGCWFYAGALSGNTAPRVLAICDASVNHQATIAYVRSGSTYKFQHKIGAQALADITTITENAWYWLTIKFIKSGTCSFAVYNSSGVQQGSTATGTDATGVQAKIVLAGNTLGVTAATGTLYFDDIIADWTDATFPLGPR